MRLYGDPESVAMRYALSGSYRLSADQQRILKGSRGAPLRTTGLVRGRILFVHVISGSSGSTASVLGCFSGAEHRGAAVAGLDFTEELFQLGISRGIEEDSVEEQDPLRHEQLLSVILAQAAVRGVAGLHVLLGGDAFHLIAPGDRDVDAVMLRKRVRKIDRILAISVDECVP